jgi:O-antigen ligase
LKLRSFLLNRPVSAGEPLDFAQFLRRIASLCFALFFFLVLTTPSWRYGPFSWWPVWEFSELAGGPVRLGILNFLPLITVFCWPAGRFLAYKQEPESLSTWQWGNRYTTLSLLGLTLWGLITLLPLPFRLQFIQAGGLTLAWLAYLFVLNERPNLKPVIAAILLLQGGVAIAQFFTQGSLGLDWLGELPLDPIYQGVSVIFARERPWLRAYGLTAHPNFLGAILTTLLLLLLPTLFQANGRRRAAWSFVFLVGLAGLVFTFSRGAGLGFLAGLGVWLFLREWRSGHTIASLQTLIRKSLKFVLPLLLLVPLFWLYSDLFLSRLTHLDAPSEAQSLNQRLSDARTALSLIAENPLSGVGLGHYTDAAKEINPQAARVHNVLLLVTAELGIPGLLLSLWLLFSPLFRRTLRAAAVAPWVAMLVIGLFDTTLWLTSNWQTAVLFGLLAANLMRGRQEMEG